ncbi:MAG TPA: hypothetical protein VJB18_00900 [Burkholderiales bacterium]|nr:hypothetical protein [Burkholderiales bacterium]
MMEQLWVLFKKYTDRINGLSLRERGVIFVAILVVIYGVAANFMFPPLNVEQTRLTKQLTDKRAQIQAFDAQIQAALTRSAVDPDAGNRAKRVQLEAQLKALDKSLATVTARLVPPKEMARMVEQILLKNRRLEVVRIGSLTPEPLQQLASAATGRGAGLTAYRQGMHIELRGNYLDILAYLRELEVLPWKMFWGQVSLKVEQYPVSYVTLRIYTLSTQPGWIAI